MMPKKPSKPKKNPSDPTLLALEVFEAAIKEPLTAKAAKKQKAKTKAKRKS